MRRIIKRRTFVASALAVVGAAATGFASRNFNVVKLFKSPDGYPNALEADKRGIWIGEQMNDMAYLVDMNGKVLHSVQTECSNTSGVAYGDGFLWLSSNGKPLRCPPKPTDYAAGGVIKTDPPGLWCVFTSNRLIQKLDPKNGRVLEEISISEDDPRPHGLCMREGRLYYSDAYIEPTGQTKPATAGYICRIDFA